MSESCIPVLVGAALVAFLAGCTVDARGGAPRGDGDIETRSQVDGEVERPASPEPGEVVATPSAPLPAAPAPEDPIAPAADPGAPPTGCWASDIALADGACATPHAHIASALAACWSGRGEPVTFSVEQACATGGFQTARVTCCPAAPTAVAPPAILPEPTTPSAQNGCGGGSSTHSDRDVCGAAVSADIVETVTRVAASGQEVRGFGAADRCADGAYATFGLVTCGPGAP